METVKMLLLTAAVVFSTDACQKPAVQGVSGRREFSASAGRESREAGNWSMQGADVNQATGEILVKFKPGVARERVDRIAQEYGLKTVRPVSPPDLYLFQVREAVSVNEMIQRLNELAEVEYAEPNHTRRPYEKMK